MYAVSCTDGFADFNFNINFDLEEMLFVDKQLTVLALPQKIK